MRHTRSIRNDRLKMSQNKLQNAIDLIRSGKTEAARLILAEILLHDPQNELAWLWTSKCYREPERKKYCFERVLNINPNNPIALKALEVIKSGGLQPAELISQPTPADQAAGKPGHSRTTHLTLSRKGRRAMLYIFVVLGLAAFALLVWAVLDALPRHIPISNAALTAHLTGKDIFCGTVGRGEQNADFKYVMHCSGYAEDGTVMIQVDVYSISDPQRVDLILAYATQMSGEISTDTMGNLLGEVAGLPYTHADPERARTWAQGSIPFLFSGKPDADPKAQFGGVRFHLARLTDTKIYLAIGEGKD